MGALNVRLDPGIEAFLDRVARETGRTRSEVVREALETVRRQGARPAELPPAKAMAGLIGCWDSGGMALSARTGEAFARLLKERKHERRTRRRRTARRAD